MSDRDNTLLSWPPYFPQPDTIADFTIKPNRAKPDKQSGHSWQIVKLPKGVGFLVTNGERNLFVSMEEEENKEEKSKAIWPSGIAGYLSNECIKHDAMNYMDEWRLSEINKKGFDKDFSGNYLEDHIISEETINSAFASLLNSKTK